MSYKKNFLFYFIFLFLVFTLSGCFVYFLSAAKILLTPKIEPDKLTKVKGLDLEQDIYTKRCSTCHILVDPLYFTTDNMNPIVNRYVKQKIINEKEAKRIITYLHTMVNKDLYDESKH